MLKAHLCRGLALLLVCATTLIASAALGSTTPTPLDAFRKLRGTWSIVSDGKPMSIQMTYHLASKESIVTEQFGNELSVFAMDGSSLTMTHYCNAGNQVRLRLSHGTAPNTYEFDSYEVVRPEGTAADHVEKIIYQFLSDKQVDLKIIWWHPSGLETEHYLLERS